jgi:hypothetical protein
MRTGRFVAVAALLTLAACGGRGTGGTNEAANVACEGDVCTVTYPAKARNNQSSSGGPPAQVLGVETKLFSISGGAANFRIADEPVSLEAGKKTTVGDLSIQAISVEDTAAVLKISKGASKAEATPKATAKAKTKAKAES